MPPLIRSSISHSFVYSFIHLSAVRFPVLCIAKNKRAASAMLRRHGKHTMCMSRDSRHAHRSEFREALPCVLAELGISYYFNSVWSFGLQTIFLSLGWLAGYLIQLPVDDEMGFVGGRMCVACWIMSQTVRRV
eukprot:GHVU01028909.1.p2 GENE.GHVU01028909.1~~GHVU01028909.1.p2  ORF type:complete len:133 (-),score=1.40 GHVU01028909.1:1148-1546(-)